MSKKKNNLQKYTMIAAPVVIIIIAILLALGGKQDEKGTGATEGQDIVINKSDITSEVTFIPAEVNGKKLELMAVKASDGTVRTAFNTCQVCNGSPLAYYVQQGDVVICQNCGNQFSMDMIGITKGGCNPVPIQDVDRTEDDTTITIGWDYVVANQGLFTDNWKSQ